MCVWDVTRTFAVEDWDVVTSQLLLGLDAY